MKDLPENVSIKTARTIGLRQQRKHRQLGVRILGSAFNLGRKLINPSIFRKGLDIGSSAINS